MAGTRWIYSIKWCNPYTTPTFDRVLARTIAGRMDNQAKEAITAVAVECGHVTGDGYSLCIDFPETKPRQLSGAALVESRKKKMISEFEAKYPLFAESFIAEELIKSKDKYDPAFCEKQQDERSKIWDELNKIDLPMDKFVICIGEASLASPAHRGIR